ncbi:MAG: DUF885 domain-containing protein [Chitinophagales bacterium]
MKNALYILVISLLLLNCGQNESTTNSTNTKNDAFAQLLEDFSEDGFKLYPLNATYNGDDRYNDQLPNYLSDEFKAAERAYYTKYLESLKEFKSEDLTEEEQLSKAVLEWECQISLESLNYPTDLTPIDQMWTLQLSIAQLASGGGAQPFNTVKDYNNWLRRLDSYLIWMQSAEDKMREGIEIGYVLPKSLIVKLIPQFEEMANTKLEDHLFYQPVVNMPDTFTTAQKDSLTTVYSDVITNKVIPAYKKMHHFLSNEYLAAGRTSSGISAVPGGEDYYNFTIKHYTTIEMTADEIYELGLAEVDRIMAEMKKVKEQVGYEGDMKSFFDHIRNSKDLMPFTTAEEVIDNFNVINEKMKPELEKLFDHKPKTPFEVRRIEAYREASASAEYNQGSMDGSRPGIFYVPVPDPTTYNVLYDEALFLHEAIPGHHYQVSLTLENEQLPNFRKNIWYGAYGEGWALYTESLGKELGLYTDPYQYLGMLTMEMHRAIRLVVDVGLHVKGWTREEAIQYSLDNEAEFEHIIISDVERYMALPGQALSYKIGQLKISELRKKAETTLGDKFDIRAFHNEILETGCIPLTLLEQKINNWIEEQK